MWKLLKGTRAIDRSEDTLQSPHGAVLVCAVVMGTPLIPELCPVKTFCSVRKASALGVCSSGCQHRYLLSQGFIQFVFSWVFF